MTLIFSRTPADIPLLTPLRGVAALLVAVFHGLMFFPTLKDVLGVHTALFDRGYLWVDFFFMLSGYVMAHVYGASFVQGIDARAARRFAVARFARIYPLHLLTLGAYVALVVAAAVAESSFDRFFEDRYALTALLGNLFLAQALGLFETTTWNPPAWSISVECAAYLILPLLCRAVGLGGRALALALAVGGVMMACLLVAVFGTIDVPIRYGVFRCLGGFMIGVALRSAIVGRFEARSGWLYAGVALAPVVAMHFESVSDLVALPLLGLLLVVSAHYRGPGLKWMNGAAAQWLGNVSYAVYLLHFLAFDALSKASMMAGLALFGPWVAPGLAGVILAVILAGVVIASGVVWRLYEIPARRWVRRRFAAGAQARPMADSPMTEAAR